MSLNYIKLYHIHQIWEKKSKRFQYIILFGNIILYYLLPLFFFLPFFFSRELARRSCVCVSLGPPFKALVGGVLRLELICFASTPSTVLSLPLLHRHSLHLILLLPVGSTTHRLDQKAVPALRTPPHPNTWWKHAAAQVVIWNLKSSGLLIIPRRRRQKWRQVGPSTERRKYQRRFSLYPNRNRILAEIAINYKTDSDYLLQRFNLNTHLSTKTEWRDHQRQDTTIGGCYFSSHLYYSSFSLSLRHGSSFEGEISRRGGEVYFEIEQWW